jgi:DNA-directed RNA polymerase specialized sigma subunit
MAEKRGRKRKNDLYFGPDEEKAVRKFLKSEDDRERNKIYNECLRAPLDKMVESIIRKYKLYRKAYSFEDLHTDTISFLITKAHKFNPEAGKKAYSYYGTICKNYILALLIKDDKVLKLNSSFEETFESIQERDDLTYHLKDTDYVLADFILSISTEIKEELESDGDSKKKLTDNERKVGEALIDILDNWETIFENMEGGSKYNKNTVLATIREHTNLTTKDIRVSMRRYKKLYTLIKGDKIDEGFL